MNKRDVLRLLDLLPDQFTPDRLIDHLSVLQQVEAGEAALQAGDVLTDAELDEEIAGWLASSGPAPR